MVVRELAALVANPVTMMTTRKAALETLAGTRSSAAHAIVIAHAARGDKTAIAQLRFISTPGAMATLTTHLRDGNKENRKAAIRALSYHKSPKATEILIGLVEAGDPSASSFIYTLATSQSPKARKVVLDAAWGGKGALRRTAISALYSLPDAEVIPVLERALTGTDKYLVSTAISGLSSRQSQQSSDLLARVLGMNIDENALRQAARQLKRRGGSVARQYRGRIDELLSSEQKGTSIYPTAHFGRGRHTVGTAE
jgi:HEAT repeat protein